MKIFKRFYADVELVAPLVAVLVYIWLVGAAAHPVGGLLVFAITFFVFHNLSGIGQTVQPGQFIAYLVAFWVTTAFVVGPLSRVEIIGLSAVAVAFPFCLMAAALIFEALFISRQYKLLYWVLFALSCVPPVYLYVGRYGWGLPFAFGG